MFLDKSRIHVFNSTVLGTMKIDSQNTGPFPMLFLLSEISDSIRLDFFFFFKEHLTKILSFKLF